MVDTLDLVLCTNECPVPPTVYFRLTAVFHAGVNTLKVPQQQSHVKVESQCWHGDSLGGRGERALSNFRVSGLPESTSETCGDDSGHRRLGVFPSAGLFPSLSF